MTEGEGVGATVSELMGLSLTERRQDAIGPIGSAPALDIRRLVRSRS
jgi:hypothetical protein